jgi:lipoprotein-anchoring transpeptidase ErfK/SrfK
MKGLKQSGIWTAVAVAAAMAAVPLSAQNAQTATTENTPAATAQVAPQREIVVSLEDHKLALLEEGRVVRIYSVAVGKPSTSSPVGTFFIRARVTNPTYYHHGKVIPPGPYNPVGNRWMSLSIPGYGIHGTDRPHSIGKAVSHGCIRLGRRDIEDLFGRVRIGDKVVLIAQRDEETAEIFGDRLAPIAPARQPVLLVKAMPLQRGLMCSQCSWFAWKP